MALLHLERNDPQKKAAALGDQHRGYVCDVTRRDACQQVAEQIIKDFGAVDILINNAGITLSAVGVLSAVPVFYAIPAAFLKGPAAAGGLALVNATGNIGGFVGPILVGWITQRTGNPASGPIPSF